MKFIEPDDNGKYNNRNLFNWYLNFFSFLPHKNLYFISFTTRRQEMQYFTFYDIFILIFHLNLEIFGDISIVNIKATSPIFEYK